jgi:glycosidase
LDWIEKLGCNALYLCPIFAASANHRYHTTNYFEIDPLLGSMADFDNLLLELHRRGMRLVLDGVFNHCGRGFFAFNSILESGAESPYLDWFHVHKFPLNAYSGKPNYECWWNLPALPKFNTENPAVREYLLSVAEYWALRGIDGWRLDVPNEIKDDQFWREFRRRVKDINPELWICGEIWDAPDYWLQGDQFDGVMNYPLKKELFRLFRPDAIGPFSLDRLRDLLNKPWSFQQMNLLGSHDTKRLRTEFPSEIERLILFALICFVPGAPCIYYGDEIGLKGGKDPECRGGFDWNKSLLEGDRLHTWLSFFLKLRCSELLFSEGEIHLEALGGGFEIKWNSKNQDFSLKVTVEPQLSLGLSGSILENPIVIN